MEVLEIMFSAKRFVWNHFLSLNMKRFEAKEGMLSYNKMSRLLTELKQENKWLYTCEKSALQNTLKDLSKAYSNFFKGLMKYSEKTFRWAKKTGKELTFYHLEGHPKFKSYKDYNQSLVMNLTNNNIEVIEKERAYTETGKYKKQNCRIKLPKIRNVKIAYSRPYEGVIQNVTIRKESDGNYYVSICCKDVPKKEVVMTSKAVGIDLGINVFATMSDGEVKSNPKYYKKAEDKISILQRCLSRKVKGSKNYHKSRLKLNKQHKKIGHKRDAYLHEYTTDLIRNYDIICIEDLKPKKMMKDKRYAKSISDASYSKFRELLTYKVLASGKQLCVVDQYYASSQICSQCYTKDSRLKDVKIRKWICPSCGEKHDRDLNASKNILREGLKQLA